MKVTLQHTPKSIKEWSNGTNKKAEFRISCLLKTTCSQQPFFKKSKNCFAMLLRERCSELCNLLKNRRCSSHFLILLDNAEHLLMYLLLTRCLLSRSYVMQNLLSCLYQKVHKDLTHVKSSEPLWEGMFFHLQLGPSFLTSVTCALTSKKNYGNNWKSNRKTLPYNLL